jgi:hypothetical protein
MSADQIRDAATTCAFLAQNMAASLLKATTPRADQAQALACMTDAFATWPLLCRRMAELEDMAPRTSNAGRDRDDELSERLAAFRAKQAQAVTA